MRRIFFIAFSLVALLFLASLGAGELLSSPANRPIGKPPPDLSLEPVELPTRNGEQVVGWFTRGNPGSGGVLLLHGIHADRTQMLDRAKFLRKQGHSVLLIDLPAHGESSGDRISFGAREGYGVATALRYLRQTLRGEKIAVIGLSLGAAAFVLSGAKPDPDAVVLESMYPTIQEAAANRLVLEFGPFGNFLTPLLLWQLPLRLGISVNDLQPIAAISSLSAPVLIAAGENDRHTTLAETQRIFDAARPPKELWIVKGAAHVNLHNFAPDAYESRISSFLAKYLKKLDSKSNLSPTDPATLESGG